MERGWQGHTCTSKWVCLGDTIIIIIIIILILVVAVVIFFSCPMQRLVWSNLGSLGDGRDKVYVHICIYARDTRVVTKGGGNAHLCHRLRMPLSLSFWLCAVCQFGDAFSCLVLSVLILQPSPSKLLLVLASILSSVLWVLVPCFFFPFRGSWPRLSCYFTLGCGRKCRPTYISFTNIFARWARHFLYILCNCPTEHSTRKPAKSPETPETCETPSPGKTVCGGAA